ncbi:MAG: hypothetical protein RSD08_03180 [Oscillospiraceae bacterium]
MDDRTHYRVKQVIARTKKLNLIREQQLCWGLSASCIVLTVALGGIFRAVTSGLPLSPPTVGGYGAVLLWSGADAYVLTGVLAFTAGVIITVICLRAQKKKRQGGKNSDEKQEKD